MTLTDIIIIVLAAAAVAAGIFVKIKSAKQGCHGSCEACRKKNCGKQ